MKLKLFFFASVILLFCGAGFAQSGSVEKGRLEGSLREIIHDSLSCEYFMKGTELQKQFKQGLISKEEYFSRKEELSRLESVRNNIRRNHSEAVASSNGIGVGSETTLAVNPNNPNQVVAAFMDTSLSGCTVYYSTDAGSTWNHSSFIPETLVANTIPGFTVYNGGCDPTITVDNNGVFYFSWICAYTTTSSTFISTLYVISSNGGAGFIAPPLNDFAITSYDQSVIAGFLDRIWITADISSGATDGTLYLNGTFADMTTATVSGQSTYVKLPGFTHFTLSPNQSIPNSPGYGCQLANVAVGNNGVVHVTAVRFDNATGYGQILYSHSNDQGQTWSPVSVLANAPLLSGGLTGGYFFDGENAMPCLAVDGNTVYLAWTDLTAAPKIFFSVSANGGNTWSAPVSIGTQICPGPYDHTFVNLAASNGNCSLAWYRVDSTNLHGDYVMGEIQNNGLTPSGYQVLSGSTIDFSTPLGFYGHYNVSSRNGCTTNTIWADGSTGVIVAYTAKVNACLLSMPEITPVNGGITIRSVYPVPAEENLQIDFSLDEGSVCTISVFDINGKEVTNPVKNGFAAGKNNYMLNVSQLAAGNYLLRIEKGNGVFLTRQFIKK